MDGSEFEFIHEKQRLTTFSNQPVDYSDKEARHRRSAMACYSVDIVNIEASGLPKDIK